MIWPFKKKSEPTDNPAENILLEIKEPGDRRPGRDPVIRDNIKQFCIETFPDNEQNAWHVRGTWHNLEHSYVLVEPEPDDVGYDRFIFHLRFLSEPEEPQITAVYCHNGKGVFPLLCTSAEGLETLPSTIIWND